VPERPVQPRRGNFQRVLLGEIRLAELVLHVEQRAQVLADALAVVDADAFLGASTRPGSGRSMTTRSTIPIGSRRSCTSNTSSPWLAPRARPPDAAARSLQLLA
jgi:hypothetical protein